MHYTITKVSQNWVPPSNFMQIFDLLQFVDLLFDVSTLFYGGHLVLKGVVSGGQLVSFILYSLELGGALDVCINIIYLWLNTSKCTSWVRSSELTFCYVLNDSSFASILVQKCLKSDITFSRCGNFIDDIITDQQKVDFEKKALKVWEYGQSIGIQHHLKGPFYMKKLCLC